MPLTGFVGYAQALDAREAGSQAALKAIEQLGRNPVSFGILIASNNVHLQQAASGVSTQLGDAPLLGFSTSAELTSQGYRQNSVVVAVLSGDFTARAEWWPGFVEDSRKAAATLVQWLQPKQPSSLLLVAADGLGGDFGEVCQALQSGEFAFAGCLAGGDLREARTSQLGGRHTGYGGLAAAQLNGSLAIGAGIAHGWQPVGLHFAVTGSKEKFITGLDGKTVPEIYSETFGYPAGEWSLPPLNDMVRQYPFGIDQGPEKPLLVRSPLFVHTDGSLRMQTQVPQGSAAQLMIGSASGCLQAAERAAAQALQALDGARPALALVFVDVAWRSLLETRAGSEIQAIQKVIGSEVPLAGGYVYGQLARSEAAGNRPELFNQSIEVVLFGEPGG